MLDSITPQMFDEWKWDFEDDPWGDFRDDLRAGIIAALLFNAHRGKNTEAAKPTDFLMFNGEQAEQSTEEMMLAAQKLTAQMGGKIT